MLSVSRRAFLASSAALVAAPAFAIDPIKRPPGKPKMSLSLAAYSYRKYLDLKKPSMTLFDFIDLCADMPLSAVELTSYYFAETTPAYIEKLKKHCDAKKLAISGVPVRNDFCLKDDAKRAAEVQHVKTWIGYAAMLGAKNMRIFAGNLPKGDTLAEAQKRVVASMEECCEVAAKAGVLLALENHGGITATPEQLLALVKPVNSPALGVNIDTGNFKTADPYADVAKIAPYGVNVQVKTEVNPTGKPKEEADLSRMVEILKKANYSGPVALEYEAAAEPRTAVPKYIAELAKLLGS